MCIRDRERRGQELTELGESEELKGGSIIKIRQSWIIMAKESQTVVLMKKEINNFLEKKLTISWRP